MFKKPKVVSIVLTWNSADFIEECLQSLEKSTLKTDILVVDNDSADNTRGLVLQKFPRVRVVNSGANLGYAGGNNFGIKIAQESKPDYIFILNPDAQVTADCIGALVGRMEGESELAACSPMIYYKNTNKIWFAGSRIKWRAGDSSQIGGNTVDNGQFDSLRYADRISGCAALIRQKAIDKVGLMDERFFLFNEETEWSVRFKRNGYAIGIEPHAKASHAVSASTGGETSPLYYYYMNRNKFLLIQKHRTWLLPIVFMSSLYINPIRLVYIYRLAGFKKAYRCAKAMLKGYYDYARGHFYMGYHN